MVLVVELEEKLTAKILLFFLPEGVCPPAFFLDFIQQEE